MTLHRYGSEEWWATVQDLLPTVLELPTAFTIGLVETFSRNASPATRCSQMSWTSNSRLRWCPSHAPSDLELVRSTEIAVGDNLMRLSGSEILEGTTLFVDGQLTDVLGIAGRVTHQWAGLESASGAVQFDVIDSPFGDLTMYLCVDRGVPRVQIHRPSAIDGSIRLEYVRLLLFTTGQQSRVELLDQYDEAQFDFAVMSLIEACVAQSPTDSVDGSRLCEVLSTFGAFRVSPAYRGFVDALDEVTTSVS